MYQRQKFSAGDSEALIDRFVRDYEATVDPGRVATLRILACWSANRKLAPGRIVGTSGLQAAVWSTTTAAPSNQILFAVAQAWLMGVNPELGDRVPIRLLRESNLDQVAGTIVGAAIAFAAGG